MSTVTTLSIKGPQLPHPTLEWLEENAGEYLTEPLPGPSQGTIVTAGVLKGGDGWIVETVIQWEITRWGVDGIITFAEHIAATWPVTVELVEEWDTHDADEQGAQGWRWQHGVLVATGATQFVWTDEPV